MLRQVGLPDSTTSNFLRIWSAWPIPRQPSPGWLQTPPCSEQSKSWLPGPSATRNSRAKTDWAPPRCATVDWSSRLSTTCLSSILTRQRSACPSNSRTGRTFQVHSQTWTPKRWSLIALQYTWYFDPTRRQAVQSQSRPLKLAAPTKPYWSKIDWSFQTLSSIGQIQRLWIRVRSTKPCKICPQTK